MQSFPFDSQIIGRDEATGLPLLDRAQSAKILQKLFEQLYTDGVFQNFENCMQVTPGTGMQVNVNAGGGCCGGAVFLEENVRTLAHQASEMEMDRIDAVVVRKDNNTTYRSTDLYILKGVPAENPVAPEPTRNDSVHEIVLAHVFIPASTTAITAQRITDTRLNEEICGIATPMERVNTKGIFDQYQAAFDEFLRMIDTLFDDTKAGSLQGQIGALDELKTEVKTSLVSAVNCLVDNKQDNITGAASTITKNNLTGERVVITDENGKITISSITKAVLEFLSGVTSNIQTQLNGKSATHSHPYVNTANVANNLTTTASGYALDARQGKALNDKYNSLNSNINRLTKLHSGNASNYNHSLTLSDDAFNYKELIVIISEGNNYAGIGIVCPVVDGNVRGGSGAITCHTVCVNITSYTQSSRLLKLNTVKWLDADNNSSLAISAIYGRN